MDSYPRQAAATGQFRHGQPRGFRITATAVYFLRSTGGRDPRLQLHRWDRHERSTEVILTGAGDALSPAELAMRERMRETASGITAFDVCGDRVVATAGGTVLAWDREQGARAVTDPIGAFDPRISPDGQWLTWVADGALQLHAWDGSARRPIVAGDEDVQWAVADFIAAEELNRSRGYWWLPDSDGLLVQRTDSREVPVWYRADPAHPEAEPAAQRYPHAGAVNATVQLWRFDLQGAGEPVVLPGYEYLAGAGRLITVFDRAQTTLTVCSPEGQVIATVEQRPWLDLVPGLPAMVDGQLLAWTDQQRRRLTIDAVPATPEDVQLRSYVGTLDDALLVTACSQPAESRLARIDAGGFTWLSPEQAYCTAVADNGLIVTSEVDWRTYRSTTTIRSSDYEPLAVVENLAEEPAVAAVPYLMASGVDEVQTAVLWPTESGEGSLPVLMYPYGGPHAQRVLAARGAYAGPQWLADQGFCVVIADGRGTPGQSPAWEYAIHRDLRDPVLDDQVRALDAVAQRYGERIDTDRVGIMGWSFGGYLAALAVLQRPDVFGAAVAGAPVTDWRLYDTAYTERYLGTPQNDPQAYEHCSLLPLAPGLRRPLLLIHGLADDNVFAAHTLQLSSALLAAGRPHEVLPLSGVTHMTPQPEVAENLLLLQVEFLQRALG